MSSEQSREFPEAAVHILTFAVKDGLGLFSGLLDWPLV